MKGESNNRVFGVGEKHVKETRTKYQGDKYILSTLEKGVNKQN